MSCRVKALEEVVEEGTALPGALQFSGIKPCLPLSSAIIYLMSRVL